MTQYLALNSAEENADTQPRGDQCRGELDLQDEQHSADGGGCEFDDYDEFY
jgi:hypothetical protein